MKILNFRFRFMFLILAFLLGVFLSSNIFYGICLLIIFFSFAIFCFRDFQFIFFLVLMIVFGFLRFYFSFPFENASDLQFFNDLEKEVGITGIVYEEPDVRVDSLRLTLDVASLIVSGKDFLVSGRVLIFTDRYPEYSYGDEVRVFGKLVAPEGDYANYLARYEVYSLMYNPLIEFKSSENGNFVFAFLYDFKSYFLNVLNELFSEPSASFLAGLLLGAKKGIPAEVTSFFKKSGLTHVVAISGYNITLILIVTSFLFGFLGRRMKIFCASFVIFIFTFLVGFSAACIRAALMGVISLFALYFGRKSNLDLVLLISAFLMILFNPKILVFDVSFQLSFLATLGLLYISPILLDSRIFSFLPNVFSIRETLAMTLSAQIMTFPIIAYNFKEISLVAPFANVFVLPFIPLAMFFGFIASFLYVFFVPFGILISFIATFFLLLIIKIAEIFSGLPFASFEIIYFSKEIFFLYYLFIFVLYVCRFRISKLEPS